MSGKHRVKAGRGRRPGVTANDLGKLRRVWKISKVHATNREESPASLMPELQDEFDPPFEALEPAECRGPLLFNSPHSGRVYPREFLLTSGSNWQRCAARRIPS